MGYEPEESIVSVARLGMSSLSRPVEAISANTDGSQSQREDRFRTRHAYSLKRIQSLAPTGRDKAYKQPFRLASTEYIDLTHQRATRR